MPFPRLPRRIQENNLILRIARQRTAKRLYIREIRSRVARAAAFTALIAAAIGISKLTVQANTHTPTIFTDPTINNLANVNTNTGQISGGPGNGQVSLRSAIIAANAHAGRGNYQFGGRNLSAPNRAGDVGNFQQRQLSQSRLQ